MRNYNLVKTAIDRATKEMQKGELSPEALERMRQAGMIRSPLRYAYGLKKGTDNLANKNGYKVVYFTDNKVEGYPSGHDIYEKIGVNPAQTGGAFTYPEAKTIYTAHPFVGTNNNPKIQLNNSMAAFHEANEALYDRKRQRTITLHRQPASKSRAALEKYLQEPNEVTETQQRLINEKYGNEFDKLSTIEKYRAIEEARQHPDTQKVVKDLNRQLLNNKLPDKHATIGMHVSPHVLLNEADMMSKIPYQHHFYGNQALLGSIRHATGENSYLARVTGRNVYRAGKRPGDAKKLWNEFNNTETIRQGKQKYNILNMAPLDENKVFHRKRAVYDTPENIAKYENDEMKKFEERMAKRKLKMSNIYSKLKRTINKLKK